jgi:hypothetical protein
MKRHSTWVIKVAAIAVTAAWGNGWARADDTPVWISSDEVKAVSPKAAQIELESQIRILELKMQQAQAELDQTEIMVKAGTAKASDLGPLKVKLAEAKAKLAKAKKGMVVAQRLLALSQPIDIELDNARIQDAADLLSRISTMGIKVDGAVPRTITVTTTAKGVPLGTALEMIANSANLSIDVNEEGGLTFKVPGKVHVNGRDIDVRGPAWPWKDDLFILGEGNFGPLGRRWESFSELPLFQDLTLPPGTRLNGLEGLGGFTQPGGQPSVTALGSNMLVIAEPGKGPKGEPGLWLTLYSIKNGRFKQTARYFHKSPPGAAPKQVKFEMVTTDYLKKKAGKVETKTKTGNPPPKK